MPSYDVAILSRVPGVGASTIKNFRQAGYVTLDDLEGIRMEALISIPGVGQATAEAILEFLQSDAASDPIQVYQHDATRKNIPPAGLASQGKVAEQPSTRYFYDPHLPPVLRFDETGQSDRLPELLEKARRESLTEDEAELLAEALRNRQPWLEWTGKREKRWFDVDPVALHIHERVSAQAIIKLAQRKPLQPSLFADPELEYRKAVQFYEHDIDWTNRLILGDSLTVMHSLAEREDLAGQVQMIYIDPPYGINYRRNFQPNINNTTVTDRNEDLTREPEQIKAYRDAWTLGIHSYLTYIKDRLIVAKKLLSSSGSIFLQISDTNQHRVRMILDEVFDPDNFVSLIAYTTTSGFTSNTLSRAGDYLLWYAKDKSQMKYHQLFTAKPSPLTDPKTKYRYVQLSDGAVRNITDEEKAGIIQLPEGAKIFRDGGLDSQGSSPEETPFSFQNETFHPAQGRHWTVNYPEGMDRLKRAERIMKTGNNISFIRYFNDFPVQPIHNLWGNVGGSVQSRSDPKIFVVQTGTTVVERCLMMTTDPGDLVLDPTCGSGTTAYVAENLGRRWITIDTSRVAIALARQRLLTAKFDYFKIIGDSVADGFDYRTVPYVRPGLIGNCLALDPVLDKWEEILEKKLADLNNELMEISDDLRAKLSLKLERKIKVEGKRSVTNADLRRWQLPVKGKKWEEWEVPFDTDPDWPVELRKLLIEYRSLWREKMNEVDNTIAAAAPQEKLVDQPTVIDGVLRVSGPFTVEGVQPVEESVNEDQSSPIGGAPDELEHFDPTQDPINVEAFVEKMILLLNQDGVRFPDNKVVKPERLEEIGGTTLHAEGEWELGGEKRRLAVAFGPQYGPITAKQVEDCLREAFRFGFDDLVFAGFTIDGAAQAIIQDDPNPKVRVHLAHIRPDVNMGDLLKDTPSSQLFTVFGMPRVRLEKQDDDEYVVEMEGVDIYDPVTNTLRPTKASKVAAWFLDGDYNGETFFVTQAFFPDKSAWDKLAKALKTIVEPDKFAAFSGTRSLPFPARKHRRIAVKVIDPRGNEVMRVIRLDDEVTYE